MSTKHPHLTSPKHPPRHPQHQRGRLSRSTRLCLLRSRLHHSNDTPRHSANDPSSPILHTSRPILPTNAYVVLSTFVYWVLTAVLPICLSCHICHSQRSEFGFVFSGCNCSVLFSIYGAGQVRVASLRRTSNLKGGFGIEGLLSDKRSFR